MAKVLVVDDDDIMRDMLVQMIRDGGYEVCSAVDGVEAVALCNTERFDLAIIDMVMPQKDGFLTIQELTRSQNYLKIIAISGGDRSFDGTTYLDLVKERGAWRTFLKPFDRQEFMAEVDGLLKTKR